MISSYEECSTIQVVHTLNHAQELFPRYAVSSFGLVRYPAAVCNYSLLSILQLRQIERLLFLDRLRLVSNTKGSRGPEQVHPSSLP